MASDNLPPMLDSTDANSFAYQSTLQRLPMDILGRAIEQVSSTDKLHSSKETMLTKLLQLRQAMTTGKETKIQPLNMDGIQDADYRLAVGELNQLLRGSIEQEKTWASIDWIVAEFLFYWSILDAIDYAHLKWDVYKSEKEAGLCGALQVLHIPMQDLNATWNSATMEHDATKRAYLRKLLRYSLAGNSADYSLWLTSNKGRTNQSEGDLFECLKPEKDFIVADDFDLLWEFVKSKAYHLNDIWFITDNSGFEFCMDLLLVEGLLRSNLCRAVVIQPKKYPIYVCDVTYDEVLEHIEAFQKSPNPLIQDKGNYLKSQYDARRLRVETDRFWSLPYSFDQLPQRLITPPHPDLCIVKGDANYRRLVHDRSWDCATPFEMSGARHFFTNVLALRVAKSEVAVGIPRNKLIQLQKDPKWWIGAKYAMVQFKRSLRSCC